MHFDLETFAECIYEAQSGGRYSLDAIDILLAEIKKCAAAERHEVPELEAAALAALDAMQKGSARSEMNHLFCVLQKIPGFCDEWTKILADHILGNRPT